MILLSVGHPVYNADLLPEITWTWNGEKSRITRPLARVIYYIMYMAQDLRTCEKPTFPTYI